MSEEELIRACAESRDGAAWDEFVSRFRRPISISIVRTARQWGPVPRHVVDDLVQETYLKLCANRCRLLLDFSTRHPEATLGYIRTIAVNVALDHFKALHSQKRGSGEVGQLLEDAAPKALAHNLGGPEAMEREVLFQQISQCLEQCSRGPNQERDCLIFWLYYQQGLTAKAIAALPTVRLTAKGVETAILRLTRLVRERLVVIRLHPDHPADPDEKGFRPAASY
jgi:RNA polymerase sigma-70 factor, ECF subfamily